MCPHMVIPICACSNPLLGHLQGKISPKSPPAVVLATFPLCMNDLFIFLFQACFIAIRVGAVSEKKIETVMVSIMRRQLADFGFPLNRVIVYYYCFILLFGATTQQEPGPLLLFRPFFRVFAIFRFPFFGICPHIVQVWSSSP